MPFMLTCKETAEMISRLSVNDLSLYNRLRMRMHLSVCKVCSAFEKQVAVLSQGAKALSTFVGPEISELAVQRIDTRLRSEKGFPNKHDDHH